MRKLLTALAVIGAATVIIYLLLAGRSGDRGAVGLAGGGPRAETGSSGRWNLILFTLDTLRADHLGCYGYQRGTSPAVDRFAARSVVFDGAVVPAPFTAPSHATMFTGLYPSGHGVLTNGYRLIGSALSLPEVLRDAGYRTAGFVAARRVLGRRFGFDQGFEVFEEGEEDQRRAAEVNRDFLRWLGTLGAGERFFAWVHYYDVHCDYNAPEPWYDMFCPDGGATLDPRDKCGKSYYNKMELSDDDVASVRAFYDGEIRYVDGRIAELLGRVRQAGLLDETIVVITSDHGESLGEKGLVGHNLCLYDYEVRVPLIIRCPGTGARPARISDQVETVSLMPSLLELLGLDHGAAFDGPSLVPLLGGGTMPPAFGFSLTAPEQGQSQLFSIRSRDRKLILNPDGGQEFYSLAGGGEQAPPPGAQGPLADRMKSALSRWILAQERRAQGKDQVLSDEVKERLKALGYVDQ